MNTIHVCALPPFISLSLYILNLGERPAIVTLSLRYWKTGTLCPSRGPEMCLTQCINKLRGHLKPWRVFLQFAWEFLSFLSQTAGKWGTAAVVTASGTTAALSTDLTRSGSLELWVWYLLEFLPYKARVPRCFNMKHWDKAAQIIT